MFTSNSLNVTELTNSGIDYPLYTNQWYDDKIFQTPVNFDLDPASTIFVSNGLRKTAHVFLYGGDPKSKTGDILQQKPFAHFNVAGEGGNDFVSVDTNYGIQAQLFEPYAHVNSNNQQAYKEGSMCEPLEVTTTDGSFNIICSGNKPVIQKSQVNGLRPNTFVFNVRGLTTGWRLKVLIYLNGNLLIDQIMSSPVTRFPIYIPIVYKAVLVEAASTNLGPKTAGESSPKWMVISDTLTVSPGQVISIALKDENPSTTQLKAWNAVKLMSTNQPTQASDSFESRVD
jgi:hypothetical protein